MALNNSADAVIDLRRRFVAEQLLRGMTQREICDALDRKKIRNAKTKKPFSLATINGDIQALKTEWRATAAQSIEMHKARIMAELAEIRRSAWAKKSYGTVLRAIEVEAQVLGLTRVSDPPPPMMPTFNIMVLPPGATPPPAALPSPELIEE